RVQAGALSRAFARDLRLAPVRRRRAPLRGSKLRDIRDECGAEDDPEPGSPAGGSKACRVGHPSGDRARAAPGDSSDPYREACGMTATELEQFGLYDPCGTRPDHREENARPGHKRFY